MTRALPDITSSPEVRQIFKIQTVRKPDVFLPGRRTLNTFKIRKKKSKKLKKKVKFFFKKFSKKKISKIFPKFFFQYFVVVVIYF